MKKKITTTNAPRAIGPYSQGIQHRTMLYTSGQIGLIPLTNMMIEGGIEEQTHRVMKNLSAVLEAANATFDHVVKSTIYIVSLENFDAVNKIYESYLHEPHPARSTVEVSRLPKGALVEIEMVAITS